MYIASRLVGVMGLSGYMLLEEGAGGTGSYAW